MCPHTTRTLHTAIYVSSYYSNLKSRYASLDGKYKAENQDLSDGFKRYTQVYVCPHTIHASHSAIYVSPYDSYYENQDLTDGFKRYTRRCSSMRTHI